MKAHVAERRVFIPSPRKGVALHASCYYTMRDVPHLMSVHMEESRSDIADVAYLRHSDDNGRSWSEPVEWPCDFEATSGTGRRHPHGPYLDPATGRCLRVWTHGVLPSDDPLEGMRQWTIHYSVSEDGGVTESAGRQIIHQGAEYDETHHLPGVTVGKNGAMMGDLGQRPLTREDGVIVVPIQVTPTGPDGEYFNPGRGFTYTDCMVLFGRWQADGSLAWTASERIVADPERTTRGVIEPTMAHLADGSLLMVMRGSNDGNPDLPGYRWQSRSSDGGETWTVPEPWACTDGEPFFSPSACSQLIPYSDGRLLWMGNVCRENPRGNSPRYPMVLCEVERETGLVVRDSITVIDDRAPDESPHLTLSNFYVREDRETGELLLYMARLFARDFREAGKEDWTTDALEQRIVVE